MKKPDGNRVVQQMIDKPVKPALPILYTKYLEIIIKSVVRKGLPAGLPPAARMPAGPLLML
jgi:hypothetical protein